MILISILFVAVCIVVFPALAWRDERRLIVQMKKCSGPVISAAADAPKLSGRAAWEFC